MHKSDEAYFLQQIKELKNRFPQYEGDRAGEMVDTTHFRIFFVKTEDKIQKILNIGEFSFENVFIRNGRNLAAYARNWIESNLTDGDDEIFMEIVKDGRDY
jgi:hypothetical protein